MVVITILILSFSTSGMSQKNDSTRVKNIYKFSLSKLIPYQLFLGYERIVSDRFSLNAQAGLLGKALYLETINELNKAYYIKPETVGSSWYAGRRAPVKLGYQLNLEIRYYPFEFEENLFIGARGGYQYANFGKDLRVKLHAEVSQSSLAFKTINAKQNSYFYGTTIGANFTFGEKMALECYFLLGRRYSEIINPVPSEPNPDFPNRFSDFYKHHLNPVDKFHFEFGLNIGFGQ